MPIRSVLVVDDEASMRHVLTLLLEERGISARACASGEDALAELEARPYDAVVTDVRMPRMSGIELLRRAREFAPGTAFVVMSAYGSEELALEAMREGAADYVSKPFQPEELVLKLRMAEERSRFSREARRLKAELLEEKGLDALVGESPPMQELAKQIRKIAPVKTTVLVTGESGTGKELVARALHELSPRAKEPFVPVNCGAIPEGLVESELFGHVKGAFTDASRSKKGLFAEADGGTIFLDEVGELPLAVQVKLLRVLQEEEIRPVGDNRAQQVDVRVIAATVRDLPERVRAGAFREDLYYRLAVLPLRLPELRERPDDIPRLAEHFRRKYNARLHRETPVRVIEPAALDLLRRYPWPGNVRELENAIERALVLADGDRLGPEALPERVRGTSSSPGTPLSPGVGAPGPESPDALSIKKATRRIEEELIARALAQTGGNRTRAAQLLEISHRALLYKLKEYGIR
jgi:two-component system response regulator AtoC